MQSTKLSRLGGLLLTLQTFDQYYPPGNALTEWEQVHQKLNLYPLIVDRKDLSLLPDLFTENAIANYAGFLPCAVGLPEIKSGIAVATAKFNTQHLSETTLIDIHPDCETANTTAYLQATLFAHPQETVGQLVQVYPYYADHFVMTSDEWRIDNRLFALMGPGLSGNLTLIGL